MNWSKLLSTKRTGQEDRASEHHDRTQFQRDYDRLIFSSPFRRMQDKTQVFPLPGSVFVHNRLTHSLEVASVGRSLGNNISRFLIENNKTTTPFVEELGSVTAAACLAHDMGNPPFGHSGEKAISQFFRSGAGRNYEEAVGNSAIWNDFINFEGNANALRVLTQQFAGRRKGGFALTYTTVSAIVKYPYASGIEGMKKYGFFQSEKEFYYSIAEELGIPEVAGKSGVFSRHPLVYIVEAADDICYQIMDIEDAHKLGILSTGETQELLLAFFDKDQLNRIGEVFSEVTDTNEQIAYLRAGIIGKLVIACTNIFCENHDTILEGNFKSGLIDCLDGNIAKAMQKCIETGYKRIYKHQSVAEIEVAGFKIIDSLLNEFIRAVLNPNDHYSGLLLSFIPDQFRISANKPVSSKIQAVLDFISGMTDVYALDLFRKINGIGLTGK